MKSITLILLLLTVFYSQHGSASNKLTSILDSAKEYLNKSTDFTSNKTQKKYYALMSIKKYTEALDNYELSKEQSQLSYNSRGILYCNIGKYFEGINDITRAIDINSSNGWIFYGRASCYMDSKKYINAIKDYDKSINLEPKVDLFYIDRGRALFAMERYINAISDYTKALKLSHIKKNDTVWELRGDAYYELGNYDKALLDYRRALDIEREQLDKMISSNPDVYSSKGMNLTNKIRRVERNKLSAQ